MCRLHELRLLYALLHPGLVHLNSCGVFVGVVFLGESAGTTGPRGEAFWFLGGVVVLGGGEVRITGPRGGTCLLRGGRSGTGVAGIFGRLRLGVEGPDLDVEGPACDLELTLLRAKSEHKNMNIVS
jgi:hypothetical protein